MRDQIMNCDAHSFKEQRACVARGARFQARSAHGSAIEASIGEQIYTGLFKSSYRPTSDGGGVVPRVSLDPDLFEGSTCTAHVMGGSRAVHVAAVSRAAVSRAAVQEPQYIKTRGILINLWGILTNISIRGGLVITFWIRGFEMIRGFPYDPAGFLSSIHAQSCCEFVASSS